MSLAPYRRRVAAPIQLSVPALLLCALLFSSAWAQGTFEKWDVFRVKEVVCMGEHIVRGATCSGANKGNALLPRLVGWGDAPPGERPVAERFPHSITPEDSERIVNCLRTILQKDFVPQSAVSYGNKTDQDLCVLGYRFRLKPEHKWNYFSFKVGLRSGFPNRVQLNGFVGNGEAIDGYDDVHAVALKYMDHSFLGPRSDYWNWNYTSDKESIKKDAEFFSWRVPTDEELRDVPRTFQINNLTKRLHLRGGKITLLDAGTQKDMYGIGFRYYSFPFPADDTSDERQKLTR